MNQGSVISSWVGSSAIAGLFSVGDVSSQAMSEEAATTQDSAASNSCTGKKKAMLAYGLIQISATVVSAISLAAIALGLCAVKQESKAFNDCVDEVIAKGRSNAQAVRFCNGGRLPKAK